MEQVYLSLGSNLGDRMANLHQAISLLRDFAVIMRLSQAYESEPVEFTAQPWFLNAVVGCEVKETLETTRERAPQALLSRLLSIESQMGRRRDAPESVAKGPRVIDLDIVLFGDRVIHSPALKVPHPAMHLRRFVLRPLAEIAPEVEHPLLRRSAEQMLRALPEDGQAVRVFGSLTPGSLTPGSLTEAGG